MSRLYLALVSASLLLAACSAEKQPAEPAGEEASVFDPMTDTLDRAAEVEDQMNQRVDELNKRLQESEGR